MTVEPLGQEPVWIEFLGASGSGKTTLVRSIPPATIATVALESGSEKIVLVCADVPLWTKLLSVARLTVVNPAILKMALEFFSSLMVLGMRRIRALRLTFQYLSLRSSEVSRSGPSRVLYLCDQGYLQLIASALISLPSPPELGYFFQQLRPRLYLPRSLDILPMYLRRNKTAGVPALPGVLAAQSEAGVTDSVCLSLAAHLGVPVVKNLSDVTSQLRHSPVLSRLRLRVENFDA
jgi:hypothetical protein